MCHLCELFHLHQPIVKFHCVHIPWMMLFCHIRKTNKRTSYKLHGQKNINMNLCNVHAPKSKTQQLQPIDTSKIVNLLKFYDLLKLLKLIYQTNIVFLLT
jgi:hypothetical protein